MIYAFIIEEYGSILGGLGLLLLYLILLYRAVRIAGQCEKPFGSLVAVGLSLMLVLQAMMNMAVAVNLVPVTGQPLPLVSMGGTSVWFTCLAIGIVLSVSRSLESERTLTPRSMVDAHEQRTPRLRVMISGGGTGGHIFPAIAIANAVREREAADPVPVRGGRGKDGDGESAGRRLHHRGSADPWFPARFHHQEHRLALARDQEHDEGTCAGPEPSDRTWRSESVDMPVDRCSLQPNA